MSHDASDASTLFAALEKVRLFLCDVDGVLTDGTVSISHGDEAKSFHIQDGLGLRLLQQSGIRVGWVSNRPSPATSRRARELKVDYLHQEKGSKVAAVEGMLAQSGADWSEVCYIGDDVVDLAVLRRVGLPVVVANAIDEAKSLARHVTRRAGGEGAVREVAELVLKAQNKWARWIEEYSA